MIEEAFNPKPKKEKPKSVKEVNEEISEVLRKFKDQAKHETKVFTENVDSEYWVAICFQTREQKEEWLRKTNLLDLGDKYIDGLEASRAMGIKLDEPVPPIRKVKISKSWKDFT